MGKACQWFHPSRDSVSGHVIRSDGNCELLTDARANKSVHTRAKKSQCAISQGRPMSFCVRDEDPIGFVLSPGALIGVRQSSFGGHMRLYRRYNIQLNVVSPSQLLIWGSPAAKSGRFNSSERKSFVIGSFAGASYSTAHQCWKHLGRSDGLRVIDQQRCGGSLDSLLVSNWTPRVLYGITFRGMPDEYMTQIVDFFLKICAFWVEIGRFRHVSMSVLDSRISECACRPR